MGGSAGHNTFIGGSGSYAFEAQGTNNKLDYSAATSAVTIDTTTNTAQNGFGGTDHFSDIQSFVGSLSGNTTFVGGSVGGHTFTGQGASNTLDYSNALHGVQIFLDPNGQGQETADPGIGSDVFTGITTIQGSTAGGNTFHAGPGNYTIEGGGGNNTLTYRDLPNPVTINADTGTAQGGFSGTENFSDIQTFFGSLNGSNTFIGGSGSYTFDGEGAGNTLDYSGATGAVTIDTATGTAQNGFGGTDHFSDIQTFGGAPTAIRSSREPAASHGKAAEAATRLTLAVSAEC